MTVRINANSCKNALGTVFLLATVFFVCSTFISMRSVFADPIAPENVAVVQSGRQSPRSTSRTSNRTIARTGASRASAGATVAPTRSTVSRGTAGSRSVSSRSITPTRPNTNVVSRGVATRGQSTRGTSNNRAVRARTATSATRVAATGNVIAAGSDRASVNTSYSYLNSRLYTGNYSNIIDSTTGLISADAYANCMDSYYACMDEICTARSTAKGRCSCAGRATNFLVAEEALQKANEELITLSGQLSLLISTKGKGDEIAAAFTLTEAEQVMNCVSWQEAKDKGEKMEDWCENHNMTDVSGCTTKAPDYCSNNTYGFSLSNLTDTNITGSSSDILAQLKSWADAKELAQQFEDKEESSFIKAFGNTYSRVFANYVGVDLNVTEEETDLDALAKKWGYKLFEYAHNNVCGRVLDSCFNGIYEACGTPPTVTDSDGIDHKKCMNGATSNCPFNYNSYIHVQTDAVTNGKYKNGDIVLNERGSSASATDKTSAACFGYSTTTTSTSTRSVTSSSDPYYSLRGPVADARRSIMQKYLLDANAACDTYSESLTNTARNINYQKVAAQQALQQKRLEFKQEEDAETRANFATYSDNFDTCLSEIWDCYEDASDEGWTTARVKTYCAQKSQVPHCYETMVCSPAGGQIEAVIDRPDQNPCIWNQDFRKNTCRNIVTISEILYSISTLASDDTSYTSLYVDDKKYDSAKLREACLQSAGVNSIRKWTMGTSKMYECEPSELEAVNAIRGYKYTKSKVDECPVIEECQTGFELLGNECVANGWSTCSIPGSTGVKFAIKLNTEGAVCTVKTCNEHYVKTNNTCVAETRNYCDTLPEHAATGTQTWNGTDWGTCVISTCQAGYEKNTDGTACEEIE